MRTTLSILLAAAILSSPAAAQEVELGPLTAQLYYKDSGKLSDDLLAREEPFVGWNTGVGEGDAEGPAEDLLVSLTLAMVDADDGAFLDETLELWVTDEGDGEVARREFSGLLLPYQGSVTNPLWLNDIACAGLLVFHARFRDQEQQAELRLDCGE